MSVWRICVQWAIWNGLCPLLHRLWSFGSRKREGGDSCHSAEGEKCCSLCEFFFFFLPQHKLYFQGKHEIIFIGMFHTFYLSQQEVIITLLSNAVAQFKKYKCPRMKSHLSMYPWHAMTSLDFEWFQILFIQDFRLHSYNLCFLYSGSNGRGILLCKGLYQSFEVSPLHYLFL